MSLALKNLPKIDDPRVLIGHNNADDAGVMKISDELALVTTVDLLAPVVNDPYDFGYVAATNCLSDIYAMGGEPLVCLNVVGWPIKIPAETLGKILEGSQDAVTASGAAVLGGHTFQDTEIRYGLAVTGRIDPAKIYANDGAVAGDDLVLTKPLGSGTVIACSVSRGAPPREAGKAALKWMKTSNRSAAEAMRDIGAHACTDITGFGFVGHSLEMAKASGVGIELHASSLPILPSVREILGQGITDGSHKMNRNSFQEMVRFEGEAAEDEVLLFSSETSGGLLISVDPGSTEALLAKLKGAGLSEACLVGKTVADHPGEVVVKA